MARERSISSTWAQVERIRRRMGNSPSDRDLALYQRARQIAGIYTSNIQRANGLSFVEASQAQNDGMYGSAGLNKRDRAVPRSVFAGEYKSNGNQGNSNT